jgi:hypothetical protein
MNQPYPDHWIRIIGAVLWAHFIKAIGYSESLFELFMERGYFTDIAAGTIITLLIWEMIRQASRRLDRHYDWLEATLMRVLLQAALGIGLPALALFFVMLLYFRYVFGVSIFDTPWLQVEYRVALLFVLMINGYYLGRYFYHRFRMAEQQLAAAARPVASPVEPGPGTVVQSLIAVKGAKNIPVPVADIAYCYVRDEHYFLHTSGGQSFMIDHTLDELDALLPTGAFFRLNRQMVAHWKACSAFKNIENGKLEVSLQPAYPEPVIVSQKKAAAFKDWLVNR